MDTVKQNSSSVRRIVTRLQKGLWSGAFLCGVLCSSCLCGSLLRVQRYAGHADKNLLIAHRCEC